MKFLFFRVWPVMPMLARDCLEKVAMRVSDAYVCFSFVCLRVICVRVLYALLASLHTESASMYTEGAHNMAFLASYHGAISCQFVCDELLSRFNFFVCVYVQTGSQGAVNASIGIAWNFVYECVCNDVVSCKQWRHRSTHD